MLSRHMCSLVLLILPKPLGLLHNSNVHYISPPSDWLSLISKTVAVCERRKKVLIPFLSHNFPTHLSFSPLFQSNLFEHFLTASVVVYNKGSNTFSNVLDNKGPSTFSNFSLYDRICFAFFVF